MEPVERKQLKMKVRKRITSTKITEKAKGTPDKRMLLLVNVCGYRLTRGKQRKFPSHGSAFLCEAGGDIYC